MDDRRRLPTPPQARQVEMHAEHAHGRFLDSHFRHGSAARFEIGKMEHIMRADLRVLADQYGIAVPAHRIGLHVDRHGFVAAEIVEQQRRNGGGPHAEATVGFLQGDDVRVDLPQHVQNTLGNPSSIRADGLADIVAGDTDRFHAVSMPERP